MDVAPSPPAPREPVPMVPDEEASKERLVRAARAALAKNRHISNRLSEKDLMLLRARALELGMPYQNPHRLDPASVRRGEGQATF